MAIAVHPREWLERRRARRDADYWIAHGFEGRYPWRVAELICARERNSCARALHGVIAELRGERLPGAAPLRRAALRPHLDQLVALEQRLRDGVPVAAAGMVAVNALLTSPDSCLYAEVEAVEPCLRKVRLRLEAR